MNWNIATDKVIQNGISGCAYRLQLSCFVKNVICVHVANITLFYFFSPGISCTT